MFETGFTVLQWSLKRFVKQYVKVYIESTIQCTCINTHIIIVVTVEPPSKGNFGTRPFVPFREAVFFSDVEFLENVVVTNKSSHFVFVQR